jgi:hypothetical protein
MDENKSHGDNVHKFFANTLHSVRSVSIWNYIFELWINTALLEMLFLKGINAIKLYLMKYYQI